MGTDLDPVEPRCLGAQYRGDGLVLDLEQLFPGDFFSAAMRTGFGLAARVVRPSPGTPMAPKAGKICAKRGTSYAWTASTIFLSPGMNRSLSKRMSGWKGASAYPLSVATVPPTISRPAPPLARVVRKAMVCSLGLPSLVGCSTAIGLSTKRFLIVSPSIFQELERTLEADTVLVSVDIFLLERTANVRKAHQ